MEILALLIGVTAAVSALVTALFTYKIAFETQKTMRINSRNAKYTANMELVVDSEKLIKNNFDLIYLHGITQKEFEKLEVSKEEFIYIFSSFRAASIFYKIDDEADIKLSSYRVNFLENKKVEKVYKLIRGKLLSIGSLTETIDDFYKEKNKVIDGKDENSIIETQTVQILESTLQKIPRYATF